MNSSLDIVVVNILIAVNHEISHLCAPYFRVYNSSSWETATAIARLHFKDSGMESGYYERDEKQGVPIWNIPSGKLEKVVKILSSPIEDDPGHTYWQFACYQWNYENNLIPANSMARYLNGEYDSKYSRDDAKSRSYVPSTQEMPETWKFDEAKAKGKKMAR